MDLWGTRGGYYISHDPVPLSPETALDNYLAVLRCYPKAVIAVNVKELFPPRDLIELNRASAFAPGSFYFDFELLEPATPGRSQRAIRAESGGEGVPLAARISDRNEPLAQCLSIPAETVWADEFDGDWLTSEHIDALRSAGRRVYVVSPELHGRGDAARRKRWVDFKAWGVDGICTDFSNEADRYFNQDS